VSHGIAGTLPLPRKPLPDESLTPHPGFLQN
jgi:hypothetical protein